MCSLYSHAISCSQIPMNNLLISQVLHSFCHLQAHVNQSLLNVVFLSLCYVMFVVSLYSTMHIIQCLLG